MNGGGASLKSALSTALSFHSVDLGRMGYASAYAVQEAAVAAVVAVREGGVGPRAIVHTVEHPPVLTVTRRAKESGHVLASAEFLAAQGVEVHDTDRGGDVTYHGPGQVVIYPIVDLNFFGLGLHDYMRMLEDVVIAACRNWGLDADREAGATGVWIGGRPDGARAKVCAMGVRVRKWVSMHGLAINVDPNMGHFQLIVPCGLAGRAVTSLKVELGERCPGMEEVKRVLVGGLERELAGRMERLQR